MTTNKKWWIAGVSVAALSLCAALSGSGIATAAYNLILNSGSALTMRPTLNFVNGGCVDNAGANRTDCTVSGGGGGGGTGGGITVFSGSTITLIGTQYLAIGGGAAISSTEASVEIESPTAASVANLSVQLSAALGIAASAVFTWRDGASSQVLTCTISGATATTCVDNTHSFSVAQGDEIDIQVVTTGTPAAVTLVIGTQFGTLSNLNPTFTISNAASTGTTLNTLTKLTGAPSTAVIAATTDTGGAVGITTAGAGTTGTAVITTAGKISCVFDGATTAGDYVQISSSTAGNCHDTGAATYPTSGQVLGRVLSTNGSGGTFGLDLFPSEITASSGGGGVTLTQLLGDSTLTAPTTATFGTSVVSSTTTGVSFANDSTGGFSGVLIQGTATLNDSNVIAELQAVPSTPYSFRMRYWENGLGNQYPFGGGLCLYNSTSGQLIVFGSFVRGGNGGGSGGQEVRVAEFSNAETFLGSVAEFSWFGFPQGRFGLSDIKFVDDGTNRFYYVIGDGIAAHQVQFYTTTDTTLFTATHIGVCTVPGANTTATGIPPTEQIKVIDWTQGTS
jgi:hypothetical protein